MIIGLAGPKLAGKGTIAAFIEKEMQAKIYSVSQILSDVAQRMHLENSRKNLIAIATGLRSEFGEDIFAQVLQKDISEEGAAIAIIDSIRMKTEYELFSQQPGFQLWYIDAPVEERYARTKTRGEKVGESTMTVEEFRAEEDAVTEQYIHQLKAKADVVIDNSKDLEDLYAQCSTVMNSK